MINTGSAENSFINNEFCHLHTPCPLGEHRDRFLHLVHAIKNRKDDYASQLSSLTLAEMSRSTFSDGESERDIAKAIYHPQVNSKATKDAELKEEKLWKSRLVLAIAEILDLEQEEIARGFSVLEDEERELFQSLHGDDSPEEDTPFSELTQLEKNLASADSRTEKNRIKAWMTIFKEAGINDVELLLTTSQDSADIVLERYEERSTSPPLQLTGLELPGLIGWNSLEALEAVSVFTAKHSELLNRLSSVLQEVVTRRSLTPEIIQSFHFSEFSLKWQTALEASFPALQYGRNPVAIYILQGISSTDLLLQTDTVESDQLNGVLVVIQ